MRLIFVIVVLATLALDCSFAIAKTRAQTKNLVPDIVDSTVRYLKGAHNSVHESRELIDAEDEERSWQDILEKLKGTNILKNTEEFKNANAAKWESVAEKIKTGGGLKTGNAAARAKWQNALAKLKAEGKLTEANKEKVIKITEEAAEAVEKNPKKWPYIKKALEIAVGATLAAIILLGIDGMTGTT